MNSNERSLNRQENEKVRVSTDVFSVSNWQKAAWRRGGGLVAVEVQKMCDMKQSSIYIPVIQKPCNSTKFGYGIKFSC